MFAIIAVSLFAIALFLMFVFLAVGARHEVEKHEREKYNALVKRCTAQYSAQMQSRHLWRD